MHISLQEDSADCSWLINIYGCRYESVHVGITLLALVECLLLLAMGGWIVWLRRDRYTFLSPSSSIGWCGCICRPHWCCLRQSGGAQRCSSALSILPGKQLHGGELGEKEPETPDVLAIAESASAADLNGAKSNAIRRGGRFTGRPLDVLLFLFTIHAGMLALFNFIMLIDQPHVPAVRFLLSDVTSWFSYWGLIWYLLAVLFCIPVTPANTAAIAEPRPGRWQRFVWPGCRQSTPDTADRPASQTELATPRQGLWQGMLIPPRWLSISIACGLSVGPVVSGFMAYLIGDAIDKMLWQRRNNLISCYWSLWSILYGTLLLLSSAYIGSLSLRIWRFYRSSHRQHSQRYGLSSSDARAIRRQLNIFLYSILVFATFTAMCILFTFTDRYVVASPARSICLEVLRNVVILPMQIFCILYNIYRSTQETRGSYNNGGSNGKGWRQRICPFLPFLLPPTTAITLDSRASNANTFHRHPPTDRPVDSNAPGDGSYLLLSTDSVTSTRPPWQHSISLHRSSAVQESYYSDQPLQSMLHSPADSIHINNNNGQSACTARSGISSNDAMLSP